MASLGTYDASDAGAPDPDEGPVTPAPDAGPAAPEDASPNSSEDAGLDAGSGAAALDADVLRCGAAGCIAAAPGVNEERQCFNVRAHIPASEVPYQPGQGDEEYVTFTSRNPASGLSTIRELSPLIDNGAVLHDMRLYKHRGAMPEGVAMGRAPVDGMTFLYAWTPGDHITFTFEDSAGIPIAGADFFTLEIHYVLRQGTSRPPNTRDASGIRVCSIRDQALLPLSFARLGGPARNGKVEGRCTPAVNEPVQLVGVFPSPNRDGGFGAMLFLQRRSGKREDIFYAPLANGNLDYWGFYLPAPVLHPGDSLGWTCTYVVSESDPDQGCALQLLHSPAGLIDGRCETVSELN